MKPSASLLKNKSIFSTPEKKFVSFANEENSFEICEPQSSKYVVSKKTIQGTPETWYMESDRKESEVKSIINLLSDSKVSIQQNFQPSNTKTFSPVKEENSSNHSVIKYQSKNNSEQEFFDKTNPNFYHEGVRKRLTFNSSKKKVPFSILQQENTNVTHIENRVSRSNSKNKKGLSLAKNLLKSSINEPQKNLSNTSELPLSSNRHHEPIEPLYCKHFFTKIYGKFVENGKISKYNFSQILLQEKLILDLVSDRHFVKKIWCELLEVTDNESVETLPMKIIFAFLISVLGYSIEEIELFETQEALMKLNPFHHSQKSIEVFKKFKNRNKEFTLIILSRPKRPNSFHRNRY